MDPNEYFRPVPTFSPDYVREFLRIRKREEYNLLDVRQMQEYAGGHLPGADLLPLGELGSRLASLDPDKPTIVYCRSGARSRAATEQLFAAGFREVYSMDGGIVAWHGVAADGPPEAGMAYFADEERAEELIALAYALEDGSQRFYASLANAIEDKEARELLKRLVAGEEGHKNALLNLAAKLYLDAIPGSGTFPASDGLASEVMEGGVEVKDAVKWAEGKGLTSIVELLMAMETNAYDLYLKMERRMEGRDGSVVFSTLSEQERGHFDLLATLLDKRL